jgi:DNA-directed RNA polymerase subunit RPC12/RpoP
MPKGHHYGRTQIRAYTSEYHRIHANAFKSLLKAPLGSYLLDAKHLSKPRQKLKLEENKCGVRFITFTINEKPQKITLALDDRSASNKLYITCPHCNKKRQHLYAVKNAYACRECLGLHHASQSERPQERLMRRIRKLRKELWGYDWPDVNNMFEQVVYWPKPKWMRWKTFKQKRNKITELEKRYWPIVGAQFKTNFNLMPSDY